MHNYNGRTKPEFNQDYEQYETACLDHIKDDQLLDLDYIYLNNRAWRFFTMGINIPNIWIHQITGDMIADYLWGGIFPKRKTVSKEEAIILIRRNWDIYQVSETLKDKTKDSLG